MKVKILKIHPDAVIPFKKHKSDFYLDCIATSEQQIAPGIWKYGLGIALQIERDTAWKSMDILLDIDGLARSSVWKTGMVLSNCKGVIDEGYTGEISAVFYQVIPEGTPYIDPQTGEEKKIERYHVGDRILQIGIGQSHPISFEEVEVLDKTNRGAKGYGSTGK